MTVSSNWSLIGPLIASASPPSQIESAIKDTTVNIIKTEKEQEIIKDKIDQADTEISEIWDTCCAKMDRMVHIGG